MDALHQQGGTPLGWEPSLAPGDPHTGRETFVRLGCEACHRGASEAGSKDDAAGEPSRPGPDLTGMGSHHPPAYFAEAILNPNAVLVDGPGYIGDDGHSTMPTYDEMTIGELRDLVAYLSSSTSSAPASCHDTGMNGAVPAVSLTAVERDGRPASQEDEGRVYFAQTYDVLPDRLPLLEAWFAAEARPLLEAYDGLLRVDTFVDATRPRAALTTLLAFRDEAALRTFLRDPATANLWQRFDEHVGPHGHHATRVPLVYRAPSLSLE